ncbi:thioredoxin-2-like [Choristoneura fumiferana]|uniref:thioredoxin-2-like n=1 Tax=Choristoneura fumiferana TaxID=7141 RepID=UPI003D15D98C
MSDESTISSSPPSTANSTGTLTASSSGKGETATEGESDYPDIEAHPSAYSLESVAAPALTSSVIGESTPDATSQVPEGAADIEPTSIRTLAELHQRLAQVPPEQLVVLYFQSNTISTRLIGHALVGLRNMFGLEIIKLDLQQHYEISSAYNINQTPTFVFIKNSEKLEQFSGADVKKLKSVINPLTKK